MVEYHARSTYSVQTLYQFFLLIWVFSNLSLVYNRKCTNVTNCHSVKWCFNLNKCSLLIFCCFNSNKPSLLLTVNSNDKGKKYTGNTHTSDSNIEPPQPLLQPDNHTAASDGDLLSGEIWPECDYLEMTSWFITQFSKF